MGAIIGDGARVIQGVVVPLLSDGLAARRQKNTGATRAAGLH